MPKQISDVVPPDNHVDSSLDRRTTQDRRAVPDRRSIRDIPLPEGRRRNINLLANSESDIAPKAPVAPLRTGLKSTLHDVRSPATPRQAAGGAPMPVSTPPTMPESQVGASYKDFATEKKAKKSSRKGIFAVVILALVVLAGALAFSFMNGATLAYTPKTAAITLTNESFTAYKTAGTDSGQLLFSVIQLSGDKGQSAPATAGEVSVSEKAKGAIIIYNNASTEVQKLVKNTRFETTDGKIYRIATDIAVPGKTAAGDPGTLEVTVTADQAGPDYNIGLSDFTLPGLKDTPQYTSVYARSKTSMVGGFIGKKKTVGQADLATAKAALETAIKADLLDKARAQVPVDFVLFPELSVISFEMLPDGSSTDAAVTVNERGNFSGVMLKKSDLAAFLATTKLGAGSATGLMTLPDVSGLTAAFSGMATPALLQADTISFTLNGGTTILWLTDEAALAADLKGKPKSELNNILKNYPSIAGASAVIKPFWKSSFPDDEQKIKIEQTK